MGHDVFVSHSSKDSAVAFAVCAALEANGIRCWIAPRDIRPGENWAASIIHAIHECKVMVLVFSDHANDSRQVHREVERAVHCGAVIAPLRIEDVLPKEDLEFFLSMSHWMDALTPPLDQRLHDFASKVRGLLHSDGSAARRRPELHYSLSAFRLSAATSLSPRRGRKHSALPAVLTAFLLAICLIAALIELARQTAPPSHFTNSTGMKFVRLNAGSFLMGSPLTEAGHSDNEVQHHVKLSQPFMIQTTPVTQKQWRLIMGNKIAAPKGETMNGEGDNYPKYFVSCKDAVKFCERLSKKENKHYRLPTEAEWEYACRAGTTSAYYNGNDEHALADAGWYAANSDAHTHAVAQKKPNPFGLYDMLGNVSQWCSDVCVPYSGDATDPRGPEDKAIRLSRAVRGGSYADEPRDCRDAYRSGMPPDLRSNAIGFRLVLDY